jgi:hypothetical protein
VDPIERGTRGNIACGWARPPSDFEVYDSYFMTSNAEKLEQWVMMRAPLEPVRLLKDEDAHGIRTLMHERGNEGKGETVEFCKPRDVLQVLLEPAVNLSEAAFELYLEFVF